jgi:hypothetical protein
MGTGSLLGTLPFWFTLMHCVTPDDKFIDKFWALRLDVIENLSRVTVRCCFCLLLFDGHKFQGVGSFSFLYFFRFLRVGICRAGVLLGRRYVAWNFMGGFPADGVSNGYIPTVAF